MGERDSRVDDYIAGLPEWQARICQRVRALIHDADPEIVETVKFRVRPYFVLQGNVCALLAAKDHVNVFIYDGGIAPDPAGIVTHGHGNSTARQILIRREGELREGAFVELIRAIVADNRAGGWRRIKGGR